MSELVKNLIRRFEYNRKHKKNYLLMFLVMAVLIAGTVTWGLKLTGVSVTAEDTEVAEALETYGLMQGASAEESRQETESTESTQENEASNSDVAVQEGSNIPVANNEEYCNIYFAAPNGWPASGNIIRVNANVGSETWKQYEMESTGKEKNGNFIYYAKIPKTDYEKYNVLDVLQFQNCKSLAINPEGTDNTITAFNNTGNGKQISEINNYIWYYSNGKLISEAYDPGPEKLAGKKLFFKNDIFTQSANFTFYINGTAVDKTELSYSEKKDVWSYKFPVDSDATAETDLKVVVDGKGYTFQWNDLTKNMVVISGENAGVSEKYTSTGTVVYFDATLSKLSYSGTENVKNSGKGMPYSDSDSIYCYVTKADKTGKKAIELSKETAKTIGSNTWSDVWKAEIPEGYTRIRFTAWPNPTDESAAANGDGTAMYDIPDDLENPCFYADTSDDVIYKGGNRGGYWDEVYTVRDAEEGKSTKINKIESGTLIQNSDTKYVDATLYDYYSDYELNGKSRSQYDVLAGGATYASQKTWVTFRQFDQALSEYYHSNGTTYPVYTGHFQPDYLDWGIRFSTIASTLNLYKYDDNKLQFQATNNSTLDSFGKGTFYAYATQGLVQNTLKNGVPQVSGTNTAAEPHFLKTFLAGNNSKNTKLGETYENAAFPFTKKTIYKEDGDGVDYWWFDSANTSLSLKKNSDNSSQYSYYLDGTAGTKNTNCYNFNSSGETISEKINETINGNENLVTQYGYFPFNNSTTSASTHNYGFGTKLSFKFRLTSNGTVKNSRGDEIPIRFRFSGDDDVWVFIDDQLVLDCGGSHGKVTGLLDFASKKAYVSNVKTAAAGGGYESCSNAPLKLTYKAGGGNGITEVSEQYNWVKDFPSGLFSKNDSKDHTITLFYMERGMWESNMSVAFNFPDENQLQVQKKVDTSGVNEKFSDLFSNQSVFSFTLKNLVTHYGTTAVSSTGTKEPRIFAKEFSGTVKASNTSNVFEKKTGGETCVHWKAKLSNTNHAWTKERLGIFSADDKTAKDISDMKYLKYDIKDDTAAPSLSKMYLVFTDENGNTEGGYLNQKVYGTSSVAKATWTTLTVDLDKFLTAADSGFDKTKIKTIGFQYDDSHDIYLKNFVFYPSASYTGLTGFIVKQDAIPDYGSAASGSLELVNGATYTSSVGDNAYVIGADGTFALENEETITFHDQFRRGSYLQLTEDLTEAQKSLFETKWTMYENDNPVKSSMPKNFTSVSGEDKSLVGIETEIVDDGRTETKDTQDNANKYNGVRPDNTFVFRSYSEADNETIFNRQKIVFTNKVRTGSLTISKKQADGSLDLSGKDYTFYVVFSNVGGMALEDEPITMGPYKLAVGATKTITGIPLNTDYRIYEVDPTDDSKLQKVKIDGKEVSIATGTITDNENGSYIEGVITNEHTAKFYNSKVPLANIKIIKKWVGQSDAQPNTVNLQLQRRTEGGSDQDWKAVNGYESIVLSKNEESSEDSDTTVWSQTLQKLEVYVSGKDGAKYEYRLVELDDDGNVIEKRGTFGKQYSVTYSGGIELAENKDGELCVTNTLIKYELPKTGAIGTKIFATAGTVIMVLGLMVFMLMRIPQGVHTNKCNKKGKRGRKK